MRLARNANWVRFTAWKPNAAVAKIEIRDVVGDFRVQATSCAALQVTVPPPVHMLAYVNRQVF
jgi:hypothetical protein